MNDEKVLISLVQLPDGKFIIKGEFGGDRQFLDPYDATKRLVLGLATFLDGQFENVDYGNELISQFEAFSKPHWEEQLKPVMFAITDNGTCTHHFFNEGDALSAVSSVNPFVGSHEMRIHNLYSRSCNLCGRTILKFS
jgi:hypothetical protein